MITIPSRNICACFEWWPSTIPIWPESTIGWKILFPIFSLRGTLYSKSSPFIDDIFSKFPFFFFSKRLLRRGNTFSSLDKFSFSFLIVYWKRLFLRLIDSERTTNKVYNQFCATLAMICCVAFFVVAHRRGRDKSQRRYAKRMGTPVFATAAIAYRWFDKRPISLDLDR